MLEMLVVFMILLTLVSIALLDYINQRDDANLRASTEGLVATIRQAQSYAKAVREHDGSFDIGYGVRIEEGASEVRLFVDENKDGSLTGEDLIETFTFNTGVVISDIDAASVVDIVFIRPVVSPSLTTGGGAAIDSVFFEIESSEGRTSNVVVNTSGQITAQ